MLTGTYTALVTPFDNAGQVDEDAFARIIALQLEGGVDGIVPVGTTGESPTLNVDEHSRVIEAAVKASGGQLKVIAGTGANSTSEAIELTRRAKDVGAEATLQVTPYYNKPNQEGLKQHFAAVADLGLPVVLYNVPGRTGREIDTATVADLAQHPHIVAVKEAAGSVDRVSDIVSRCDITVLSGDDSLTLPMMIAGAKGVISVASNVAPGPLARLTHSALAGDWETARKLHSLYYPLFRDLFIDTNPIPVKAALAMMGIIEEVYRLPLCSLDPGRKKKLQATLRDLDLL